MSLRHAVLGFAAALALAAPTGYALQEFTLDEARTRIERLEARVVVLEANRFPLRLTDVERSYIKGIDSATSGVPAAINTLEDLLADPRMGDPVWRSQLDETAETLTVAHGLAELFIEPPSMEDIDARILEGLALLAEAGQQAQAAASASDAEGIAAARATLAEGMAVVREGVDDLNAFVTDRGE